MLTHAKDFRLKNETLIKQKKISTYWSILVQLRQFHFILYVNINICLLFQNKISNPVISLAFSIVSR